MWLRVGAVLGRSFMVMQDTFLRIQTHLPLPAVELLHPDKGSEFLNWNLACFWEERL